VLGKVGLQDFVLCAHCKHMSSKHCHHQEMLCLLHILSRTCDVSFEVLLESMASSGRPLLFIFPVSLLMQALLFSVSAHVAVCFIFRIIIVGTKKGENSEL
jgi:hypothetical protein